jgi:hypothetical protein
MKIGQLVMWTGTWNTDGPNIGLIIGYGGWGLLTVLWLGGQHLCCLVDPYALRVIS